MTMIASPAWTLADRIRRARLLAGLDQQQLADATGLSRNSISNYERGQTEPNLTGAVRIAAATGQPLEWFAEAVTAAESPAGDASGAVARPEGFEPPTFCSVVLLGVLLSALVRESFARSNDSAKEADR